MSGARNKAKKLWRAEDEVERLRDEEKQERFAKVTQNGDNSKSHP